MKNKIPVLIFARSRLRVEIISTYLREQCPELNGRIAGYRGGYLPNERRAIEQGLRGGKILGVVSTNALELGIDIGMLDAAITVGYPGSISSMHQQLGRAGRRGSHRWPSSSPTSPLDQYIAANADFLIKNPESATINPTTRLSSWTISSAPHSAAAEEGAFAPSCHAPDAEYLDERAL